MRIYLIGPRACGKTSIGRMLASRMSYGFVDTDEIVVQRVGESIASLVDRDGWESFRNQEQDVLSDLSHSNDLVIATGGGIILRPANRQVLQGRGITVYLQASAETLSSRLAAEPLAEQRPALTDTSPVLEVRSVLKEREPLYLECADITVSAEESLDLVADAILTSIKRRGEYS